MLPIYVDLDDVLSDSTKTYVEILKRKFGKTIAFEDIASFDLKRSFGLSNREFDLFFQMIHQPEEIIRFSPIPGAIDVLNGWAGKGYEIAIVTGRLTNAYEASVDWLERHHVPYDSFIMVDKYSRPGIDENIAVSMAEFSQYQFCLAVEDSATVAQHLSENMGIPVALMDRPWNRRMDLNGRIRRFSSWVEIGNEIQNP